MSEYGILAYVTLTDVGTKQIIQKTKQDENTPHEKNWGHGMEILLKLVTYENVSRH